MANVRPSVVQIGGQTQGTGITTLLDPVYVFKGKLRATATRDKFYDSADLRWLEGYARTQLRQNSHAFDLYYAGLAMKRHPELQLCFTRIGIDIDAAKARVASIDLDNIPRQEIGDVQRGLLAPADA